MKIAIYNKSTGLILRITHALPDQIEHQISAEEDFFLNCPDKVSHIIDGLPIMVSPEADCHNDCLIRIRVERDRRLSACDWTMMPDAQLSDEDRAKWVKYRQALRDFPLSCDPFNPVWPVK